MMEDNLLVKYNDQRRNAKRRKIEWHFTFETWLGWWKLTNKLHLRGFIKKYYKGQKLSG